MVMLIKLLIFDLIYFATYLIMLMNSSISKFLIPFFKSFLEKCLCLSFKAILSSDKVFL